MTKPALSEEARELVEALDYLANTTSYLPALQHALDSISESLERGEITVETARGLMSRIVDLRPLILKAASTTES